MKNRLLIFDAGQLDNRELFDRLYDITPAERKKKISAMKHEESKRLSLAAGALLAYVMKTQGISHRELIVGEHGKPAFNKCEVNFNLSHSSGFAVCAVSDRTVGVDIEGIRKFSSRLAQKVFTPQELGQLKELYGGEDMDEHYTRLWTVKESVLKYLGVGIGLSPQKIHLDLSGCVKADCDVQDLSDLNFTFFEEQERLITVCSEYDSFCEKAERISPLDIL